MTFIIENNQTWYNYICSRSLTETAFFIVNRSHTHLWQGFAGSVAKVMAAQHKAPNLDI